MDNLKKIVKEKYGQIARGAKIELAGDDCCSSPGCCSGVDFTIFSESYEKLEGYNPDADMGLGCGIPTEFAKIKEGDTVLDLGSGAGNDCFVASALTGESGRVIGLDMTESMIEKARENATRLAYTNVEFVLGDIENMPFENSLFDVVISNCVLNLVPDKLKAFLEINRVLKPGGHFCVSDVVVIGELPDKLRSDAEMYAGCVSGAIQLDEYIRIISDSKFENIIIHKQRAITIPDDVLGSYLSDCELSRFKNGSSGIFSVTVSGSKL